MINIKSQITQKVVEQKMDYLVPGTELASDIHTESATILASKGTIINKALIENLKKWNIDTVKIIAEISENPIIDPKIQQFWNSYNQTVTVVQQAFDNIRQSQEVPIETFTQAADAIVGDISDSINIIDNILLLIYRK